MSLPDPLLLATRYARPVLVAGLAAGIALPGPAQVLSGWIPEMVVILLFLGALRLSPTDLRALGSGLPRAAWFVLVGQLMLPMTVLAIAFALGAAQSPVTLALVLLACAPPIVSSPNIAAIMRLDVPTAMQLMVLGSVLLPVTVLPVFWFMPALGSAEQILGATLRLVLTILLAGGGALLLRRIAFTDTGPQTLQRIDGLSVLALAIFVIALMASVSDAIATAPATFVFWLVIAFAANFGTQIVMLGLGRDPVSGARAFVAGNRNVSLFFVALPPELTAPLLVFLGCYQLPMLLTPVLLARLYRH
ncbi:hypothetical protein [Sedimentitalea todarodis]|uniref:Bile acid:sodium symporter n=1 Tax=Sedimentitalea todarodis TaxID=1631240 RepID=A0ABU3VBI3_9RHOB|nr:hypothetical protein [Sedimentitalea todarodis]MDU9003433.1 hypothetical protein [Sedimentitalea todarodis]